MSVLVAKRKKRVLLITCDLFIFLREFPLMCLACFTGLTAAAPFAEIYSGCWGYNSILSCNSRHVLCALLADPLASRCLRYACYHPSLSMHLVLVKGARCATPEND